MAAGYCSAGHCQAGPGADADAGSVKARAGAIHLHADPIHPDRDDSGVNDGEAIHYGTNPPGCQARRGSDPSIGASPPASARA